MKISTFIVAMVVFWTVPSLGQQWDVGGNNLSVDEWFGADGNSNIPISFEHRTTINAGHFQWRTGVNGASERMRLTNGGWLGLNTSAPAMMFHVSEGGILSTGTTGNQPALNPGSRFIWVPSSQSLRAGTAIGTEWDAANVGSHSFAFGEDLLVRGNYAFAGGKDNDIDSAAHYSVAFGKENHIGVNATHALAVGVGNEIGSQFSVALGELNIAGGGPGSAACVALGDKNEAYGHDTFAAGEFNFSTGRASFSIGYENYTYGQGCGAMGYLNTAGNDTVHDFAILALGFNNEVLSSYSSALGDSILIPDGNNYSIAIGRHLQSGGDSLILIGQGLADNPLVNGISHSLMVGFNSDVPTLFVNGGDGTQNSFGSLGIGNITSPTERLDVNGSARLRQMNADTAQVLITGVIADTVGDYVLNYLSFTNDANDFLNGNGEWTDFSSLCDWNISGSNLVMGYTDACNEGNVGIGLNNPNSKLEVSNTLAGAGTSVLINSTSTGDVFHHGLRTNTTGGQDQNVAIYGLATADADGIGCTDKTTLIGVAGIADADSNIRILSIGIYGESVFPTNTVDCNVSYAGYFAGPIVSGGGVAPIFLSDNNLKTDVQEYTEGLNVIMNLKPKSYRMNSEMLACANPEEISFGLIAQDVMEVMPEIVEEVPIPVGHDENNIPQFSEEMYYGIQYTELIPVLISAVQEQQAQINALSEQLAACCAVDGGQRSGQAEPENDIRIEQSQAQRHHLAQNFPNPFEANTSIRFTLAGDCHASICIYNSNGSKIDCLLNQPYPAGEHQIEWNTSDLAPGIYFYTLECDGFEQVRRAVKL